MFFTVGDLNSTNQLITAEWKNMSDEAKVTAIATAKAELEREEGAAVDQELAVQASRKKYIKDYSAEMSKAVGGLVQFSAFILMVIYRLPFRKHVRVSKRLALSYFRSWEVCPPNRKFSRPVQVPRRLGRH
jgi:hypothetical protein